MTGDGQLIPDLLARVALKDYEEGSNKVEEKDTPNTNSDCNEYWQVFFSAGIEDSGVLKKNREFSKERGWVVESANDIGSLYCQQRIQTYGVASQYLT